MSGMKELGYMELFEMVRCGDVAAFSAAWPSSGLGVDFAEPESDVTSLCIAAEHSQVDMVQHLLALRADVSRATAVSGNTALHFAARADCPEVLAVLSDAGANCAAQNKNGDTPLLHAVASGRLSSVRWLIATASAATARGTGSGRGRGGGKARSSGVYAANRNGMTPLMVAAARSEVEVLRAVLEAAPATGAWLIEQDKDGATVLHHAVKSRAAAAPECVRELLGAEGARQAVVMREKRGLTPRDVAGACSQEGPIACHTVLADYFAAAEAQSAALMAEVDTWGAEASTVRRGGKKKGKGSTNKALESLAEDARSEEGGSCMEERRERGTDCGAQATDAGRDARAVGVAAGSARPDSGDAVAAKDSVRKVGAGADMREEVAAQDEVDGGEWLAVAPGRRQGGGHRGGQSLGRGSAVAAVRGGRRGLGSRAETDGRGQRGAVCRRRRPR